ncbi:YeeE/YedE thiosulfate transporter family protein [Neobacillus sp. SM06]|uniref:YeeE/YedE thiosulfate transporter family protein n=1 Tax=Neobacillus sp. SM06 TaxID=3422492 RepID=UPI003D2C67E3
MKIQSHPIYKKLFKNAWPYWLGGLLLGLINMLMFSATGKAWGVTTAFAYWGAWIFQGFGGHPETWAFFQGNKMDALLHETIFSHAESITDLGIIVGAFFAALAASQFKIKKIKSMKQVVAAIAGGLLMGYGARLSFGCNIGALFSGTASLSLHGWVFIIFIFIGAWIGSKILVKWIM